MTSILRTVLPPATDGHRFSRAAAPVTPVRGEGASRRRSTRRPRWSRTGARTESPRGGRGESRSRRRDRMSETRVGTFGDASLDFRVARRESERRDRCPARRNIRWPRRARRGHRHGSERASLAFGEALPDSRVDVLCGGTPSVSTQDGFGTATRLGAPKKHPPRPGRHVAAGVIIASDELNHGTTRGDRWAHRARAGRCERGRGADCIVLECSSP